MDTTRTITVDGQSLPVTENLWLALRSLKILGLKTIRNLWVDAICINQKNITERTTQVRRMTDIYSTVDSTGVWLGEATKDSAIVLNVMRRLSFFVMMRLLRMVYSNDPRVPDDGYFLADVPGLKEVADKFFHKRLSRYDKEHVFWPALSDFLRRPWFRRHWVIQEVALSKITFFNVGNDYMTGWAFAIACKAISLHITSHPALIDESEASIALQAILFTYNAKLTRWLSNPRRLFMQGARLYEASRWKAKRFYSQRLEVLIGRTLVIIV
ncbi:hypothetical protein MMC14_009214 [Varicellaria rhodocarpa]|nr:hypothetical protein [Varicellaria rhodocarpa]